MGSSWRVRPTLRYRIRSSRPSFPRMWAHIQIWFKPSAAGGIPRWGNKPFPKVDRAGVFVPLASGRNAEGALPIRTDAEVYGALLRTGAKTSVAWAAVHEGEHWRHPRGEKNSRLPAEADIRRHPGTLAGRPAPCRCRTRHPSQGQPRIRQATRSQ